MVMLQNDTIRCLRRKKTGGGVHLFLTALHGRQLSADSQTGQRFEVREISNRESTSAPTRGYIIQLSEPPHKIKILKKITRPGDFLFQMLISQSPSIEFLPADRFAIFRAHLPFHSFKFHFQMVAHFVNGFV